jgi:hypothetical protein
MLNEASAGFALADRRRVFTCFWKLDKLRSCCSANISLHLGILVYNIVEVHMVSLIRLKAVVKIYLPPNHAWAIIVHATRRVGYVAACCVEQVIHDASTCFAGW